MGGYYLLAAALGVAVYFGCAPIPVHPYLLMLIEIGVYDGLYLLISHLLKLEGFLTYREILQKKLKRSSN